MTARTAAGIALALALGAGGLAAQGDSLPNCILVCKPQVVEGGIISFVCKLDCAVDHADMNFLNAQSAGHPHMARFTNPAGCPGPPLGTCAFGDEVFEYTAGDTVVLGVGLWAVPGAFWLPGTSSIFSVEVSIVPVVSVLVEQQLDLLPWTSLGSATLDTASGFWELLWDSTPYDDPAGYLFRADVVDISLGTLTAYNLAHDPDACGFHTYGDFEAGSTSAGANVLSLRGSAGTSPGETARLVTKNVPGLGVFTVVCRATDQSPFLGGSLWVDFGTRAYSTWVPARNGKAVWRLPLPDLPSLLGETFYAQSFAPDPFAPMGMALSNGVRLNVCP